jgi:hypothetical protein
MAAFVTDQFRILNAGSFVESISNNSYYAFLGLSNPTPASVGFGRLDDWNTSSTNNPVDNFQYLSHYRDTSLFGRKITSENARRVVKKIEWVQNDKYDMYRHDYRQDNLPSVSQSLRLYDAKYYIITSEFKVYICIENGTSGTNPTVPQSTIEPTHTDVEPVLYSDKYKWKFLFKILPSDVIKFDSTEFLIVPNDWLTTTDSDIEIIREGGDSGINNNQIKTVYIEEGGQGYTNGFTANIIGDGTGGQVSITTDTNGKIIGVIVTQGGKGYTYGIVDLKDAGGVGSKLIPIIPPSKGHGSDIYTELGSDRVLLYARFDDSTKDFPIDTKFSQVGIIKNPETFSENQVGTGVTFTGTEFSSLYSIALDSAVSVSIGDTITQDQDNGKVAKGYIASYDSETKVLKYYQDRSLYFGSVPPIDQRDNPNNIDVCPFVSDKPLSVGVITDFSGSVMTVDSKQINLGVTFSKGLANPEINKKTGDIIYIDNRPIVQRDSRQKEDVKIILEF